MESRIFDSTEITDYRYKYVDTNIKNIFFTYVFRNYIKINLMRSTIDKHIDSQTSIILSACIFPFTRDPKSHQFQYLNLICFLVTENGLLSYENPNYHLDPSRVESAIYTDLYEMHDEKHTPDDYDSYLDNRR